MLQVEFGHFVGVEVRRVHHLISVLSHRYPVFAHLATSLLDRNQEVLLPHPEEATGAHIQESRKARIPIDVEVLYGSYLLAVDVVDVEVADVLSALFEAEVRIAHLDEIGLLLRVFYLCLPYMPTFPMRVFDTLVILLLRFFVHFFIRFFSRATLGRSPSTQKQ